jgi:hypothetical protein
MQTCRSQGRVHLGAPFGHLGAPVVRLAVSLAALLCVPVPTARAQGGERGDTVQMVSPASPAPPGEGDGQGRLGPLRVDGSAALLFEGYHASGISDRRAPGSMQFSGNASFDLFGLRSGITLLYSTDRSGLRQSADRLHYSGRWRFVALEAGDVAPTYSQYSLSGVTLRGGHADLRPGPVLLSLTGGRAQRAVEPSSAVEFREAAYRRTLYAAQAGVDFGAYRFALSGLLARDDTASLRDPGAAVPKENISLSPDFRVTVAGGRLHLEAEGTYSALTHDTRNPAPDLSRTELPDLLVEVLRPKSGTRADYAGRLAADLNLNDYGVRASYERVQPGFESLGASQLRSDQEVLTLRPRVSLLARRLNFDGTVSTARNNLLGQSARSVRRNQIGTSVQARVSHGFTVSGTVQQIENRSEPTETGTPGPIAPGPIAPGGYGELRQVARSFSITPTLSLVRGVLVHTATLGVSTQSVDDQSDATIPAEVRAAYASSGFNSTATYALAFPSGLSLSATANHTRSEAAAFESSMNSLTLGAGRSFLERRLSVNTTGTWSTTGSETRLDALGGDPVSSDTRQLSANLTSSYRLGRGNTLRFSLRAFSSAVLAGAGRSYSELFSTLQFEHSF